eukprot:NODE_5243_length_1793_cov_6.473589.p1 GENE.NODE_5243_length_1793_cov_6.473589~~NODE_5243_length_1793_cov_6.473589.p1  ORF type:complete len:504 (-),score=161.98 NODE_5243_length_1793_cov_6.473589:161-1672(-)
MAAAAPAPVTRAGLLGVIAERGSIADTVALAEEQGWDHEAVVGLLKSVEARGLVTTTTTKRECWRRTGEGEEYVAKGSPEAQVFAFVKLNGSTTNQDITTTFGEMGKLGVGAAMKNRWLTVDKATKAYTAACDLITDEVRRDLTSLDILDKKALEGLKKRKLIELRHITVYKVEKTSEFTTEEKKDAVTEITEEMLRKGTWTENEFKPFNFNNVSGSVCRGGHLHPFLKVRTEIRTVLLNMGFEEMKTNQWVESSFWNFDSLFQPQQHPARDSHDTFFMSDPELAQNLPMEYLARVKEMHENGGQGSTGWRYDWSEHEARKNILRTHTTSVSARTLYQMGEEYKSAGVFTPRKCFSIDRVFRNESLDATHLAEFHQVEGFVADRNLGLGDLIGTIREFFRRIGIAKLRFKPAYNPYTEPSMEVFGYHPTLKKWVEVGNSGVFRPEMLLPMGLPEDVSVIAWGIGLERHALLKYNVASIRELFGSKQDLASTAKQPVCWITAMA